MLACDLTALMTPHGAEIRRMFGGTAFMVNGNLAIGTYRKTGLIVRVGPDATAHAVGMGATQMVMGTRVMKGWVLVDMPDDLVPWIDMALAFNHTLPPDAAKHRSRTA
ncbi:MAG: TfoX/Sxy family protein [Cypionkella sp.]